MSKKFFLLFVLINLSLASGVQAFFLIPYLDITLVINSAGGDGLFNYHLSGVNGLEQDFSVQTTQGTGSFFLEATIFGASSGEFTLTNVDLSGWSNSSIVCSSTNPQITSTLINSGVKIIGYPYSAVTCVLSYQPVSNKVPVLIVPGVLGTNIKKGVELMWIDMDKMFVDVGDSFMDPLKFQANLQPLDNSLVVSDIIRRATGTPDTLINYDYTGGLITEFANQGYTENQDLFVFPYDWRYGVSGKDGGGVYVNEDALKQKIQAILDQTHASKVDVVAHSTGGLLVKKYVIDNPDHHIGKAVFVGVPNTGAPKAAKVLVQGDNFGVPWLADAEMKKIGQNLPVLYDLAPSRTYVDRKGSFYRTIDQKFLAKDTVTDLSYDTAWDLLVHSRGANQTALTNAENLHSQSFDDFDLRTAGVDLYSVVGCKRGTIGQVVERRVPSLFGGSIITYDQPLETPGDGTVPLESATNLPIDAAHKFYGLKAEHGQMLSQDGTRQQIVNIIAGSSLAAPNITSDITKCKLHGKALSIFSPLDISVTDSEGKVLGFGSDGSTQNTIPNADFGVFGDHKFVYLPDDEGQQYTIHFKGTGTGTFTLKDQTITDNVPGQTSTFINIPVTSSLSAKLVEGNTDALALDTNSDGTIDKTVLPTATLTPLQSEDVLSPQTIAQVTGTQGQPGYYRSGVSVKLSATDLAQAGAVSSGVESTTYRLDANTTYTQYISPIAVSTEGQHTVRFFTTDRAGNVELEQVLTFTIDKTAPEAQLQWSSSAKDIVITGVDTGGATTVVESGATVTVTDQAGNTLLLFFKDRDRKKTLHAELTGLMYNGIKQDISKVQFLFAWELNKIGELTKLAQVVASRNNFLIGATYSSSTNVTTLTGLDANGPIYKKVPGLALLKVITSKADFSWSY